MSVAEILAAARNADGAGDEASDAPDEASDAPVADETAEATSTPGPAEKAPPEQAAAGPAKPASKPGERPSVADMLAMARGGGAGAQDKPAEKPVAKATSKSAAAKAKGKPAATKPAERMDTASVLAAARTHAKRGPVSKAEAARHPAPTKDKAKPKPPAPKMPERPVYASPKPTPYASSTEQPDTGRRTMVLGAVFGTFLRTGMALTAATFGLWTLAFARFMFPNILTEPPSKFKIGFPGGIAPGTVETKFKAQFGVWVVNSEYQGNGMIFALSTVCTHLGCTPNWLDAEQKFKCPCHGSGFYKDGINFEGPAPRPLERYAIRVADDGQLEIDKSQKFQEEIGQWEDPASFVPV
jgi:cytochrome b6-f complex iron-sulfur subunit